MNVLLRASSNMTSSASYSGMSGTRRLVTSSISAWTFSRQRA